MVDLTNVLKNLLQNKYTSGVQDALYAKHYLRKRFQQDFETILADGSRVVDAVQVKRNTAGRWVTEQEAFPEPQTADVKNTAWFPAWYRAAGSVSYTTDKRTTLKAFASAMTLEMQGIRDDTGNKMEMAMCMDGSGLLAKIDVVTPGGVEFYIPRERAYRLEEGYPIQFWVVGNFADFDASATTTMRANPSAQAYYTVAAVDFDIDPAVATITDEFGNAGLPVAKVTVEENLDAAVADNDYVVLAGSLVASGSLVYSKTAMGIGGIAGMSRNYTATPYDAITYGATFQQQTDDPSPNPTDSFYGISPATNPKWRPIAIDAAGREPDPRLFQVALTAIKTRSGRAVDEVSDIYLHSRHLDVWASNRYAEERLYLQPESGMEKGNRGMEFQRRERMYPTYAGIPLCDGRYFDTDKAYVIMRSHIRIGVLQKFQLWALGDGGLHKAYNRTPRIDFEWQGFENMAPKLRNCHAVIYNLSQNFE